jgi:hypothetical protein
MFTLRGKLDIFCSIKASCTDLYKSPDDVLNERNIAIFILIVFSVKRNQVFPVIVLSAIV